MAIKQLNILSVIFFQVSAALRWYSKIQYLRKHCKWQWKDGYQVRHPSSLGTRRRRVCQRDFGQRIDLSQLPRGLPQLALSRGTIASNTGAQWRRLRRGQPRIIHSEQSRGPLDLVQGMSRLLQAFGSYRLGHHGCQDAQKNSRLGVEVLQDLALGYQILLAILAISISTAGIDCASVARNDLVRPVYGGETRRRRVELPETN